LIRLAGTGSGAVQREVARLARSGLITVRSIGNQKHYQSNPDSPLFDELRSIARKSFGLAEPLRMTLSKVASRIQAAFVYGSVAKREDTAGSDVDLMVIAEKLPYGDLVKLLEEASLAIGRPINPTVFSSPEFSRRRRQRDSFVSRVLAQPKIWLIGNEHVLPA
jgi:predicted nucleotidyltransferase